MKRNSLMLMVFLLSAAATAAFFWNFVELENSGKVTITEATASPLHGQDGAVRVMLKLKNEGTPQTIVSVTSPDTDQAMLHGVEASEQLVIPADANASFSADGAHLMLMGLGSELEDGRLLTIKMELEPAGIVTTKARFSNKSNSKHGAHQMQMADTDKSVAANMPKHAGMFMVPANEPMPSLSVSIEPLTETRGWRILSDVENFTFNRELADGDHLPGNGHGHIYLNGLKLGRVYEREFAIGQLPVGKHQIRVTLNTNNHQTYMVGGEAVSATVDIEVK